MKEYGKYAQGNKYYPGEERKKSIIINTKPYIVKFQKNSREGLCFNHISEYLGSHIFALLGTYKGENVFMKDFLEDNEIFVPFNGVIVF